MRWFSMSSTRWLRIVRVAMTSMTGQLPTNLDCVCGWWWWWKESIKKCFHSISSHSFTSLTHQFFLSYSNFCLRLNCCTPSVSHVVRCSITVLPLFFFVQFGRIFPISSKLSVTVTIVNVISYLFISHFYDDYFVFTSLERSLSHPIDAGVLVFTYRLGK